MMEVLKDVGIGAGIVLLLMFVVFPWMDKVFRAFQERKRGLHAGHVALEELKARVEELEKSYAQLKGLFEPCPHCSGRRIPSETHVPSEAERIYNSLRTMRT